MNVRKQNALTDSIYTFYYNNQDLGYSSLENCNLWLKTQKNITTEEAVFALKTFKELKSISVDFFNEVHKIILKKETKNDKIGKY